jgi:two-component system sensor histidine kinase RegB
VISADAGADRAESGHRLPVGSYLDEVIHEWQAQRPETRLEARMGNTADNAEIVADRTLSQALVNILNNAADASPDEIRLEASWTVSELLLSVADRGAGITLDIHNQLGKSPVSTKAGGLGVGLYLAHATLQRLGGAVTISNRKNGGTLTRITLPLLPGKE